MNPTADEPGRAAVDSDGSRACRAAARGGIGSAPGSDSSRARELPVTLVDAALLVLRVVLGLTYVAHGLRKLGVGGGEGFAGFRGSIARRGYRPAAAWAAAAVGAEVVGGGLVAVGLLTPIGAALLVGQSLTIVGLVAPRGFWHDRGGIEYPMLLGTASLAIALIGPGALSVDSALGIRLDPALAAGAVAVTAVGAVVGLALRRPAPA